MKPFRRSLACLVSLLICMSVVGFAQVSTDVVVYGGTPGGVMAAVASARAGKHVALVEPNYYIGGLIAGGLTKTDIGRRETVGGLSAEFFSRVQAYYDKTYGPKSEQARASRGGLFFEPHVAAAVFEQMLTDSGVQVVKRSRIIRSTVTQGRISSIAVFNYQSQKETTISGRMFIDASYEGDLMASAGVPYRVGREGAGEYNESLAGMNKGPAEYLGKGDHRVQSYNIRSTITNRDDLRIPIPKPKNYTPEIFADFLEHIHKKHIRTFEQLFPDVPEWGGINGKFDPNKADAVGVNYEYPDGNYKVRQQIYEAIRDQWLTFWYMLQNDPSLSEEFRASAKKWGLPKDEFVESGNISPQLYVREARRMQGRYMLTQRDVQVDRYKPDGVCMGSYNMDSHEVQKILTPKGLEAEGFMIVGTDPYEIPYRSITPIAPENLLVVAAISATHVAYSSLRMEPVYMMLGQVGGLAAAQALDEGHSVQAISVEKLRQSLSKAGIPLAAPFRPVVEIGVDANGAIQPGETVHFKVIQQAVRAKLQKFYWNFDGSGEVQGSAETTTWKFPVAKDWTVSLVVEDEKGNLSLVAKKIVRVGDGGAGDVGVDYDHAQVKGLWDRSGGTGIDDRGRSPRHDLNKDKGTKSATFTSSVLRSGRYRVAMAFSTLGNRATNVPVVVTYAKGEKKITVNERDKKSPFAFAPLGEFEFSAGKPATVTITTEGTDGYVVIDEIRWIWLGPSQS